jgi:hypothetical protein
VRASSFCTNYATKMPFWKGTRTIAEDKIVKAEKKFGLFVFHEQSEDSINVVDIVAVHGLNGHFQKTWQTTQDGQEVNWLRDFLPKQIPFARVLSFSYNSTVMFTKSVADIGTFSEQLLEDLLSMRSGLAASRPIIFVCHSLGGIVVKKVRNS